MPIKPEQIFPPKRKRLSPNDIVLALLPGQSGFPDNRVQMHSPSVELYLTTRYIRNNNNSNFLELKMPISIIAVADVPANTDSSEDRRFRKWMVECPNTNNILGCSMQSNSARKLWNAFPQAVYKPAHNVTAGCQ